MAVCPSVVVSDSFIPPNKNLAEKTLEGISTDDDRNIATIEILTCESKDIFKEGTNKNASLTVPGEAGEFSVRAKRSGG
jgi:hypothetical protein